jgi:hypothetical protein
MQRPIEYTGAWADSWEARELMRRTVSEGKRLQAELEGTLVDPDTFDAWRHADLPGFASRQLNPKPEARSHVPVTESRASGTKTGAEAIGELRAMQTIWAIEEAERDHQLHPHDPRYALARLRAKQIPPWWREGAG